MFKNAKIRVKILIGFSIILFMMLITAACSFYSLNYMNNNQNKIINEVMPLNNLIKEINTDLVNEETGVRGYIASNGDTKYLDSYNTSNKDINNKIKEIKKYYNNNQDLKTIIENEQIPNIEVIDKHFESQISLVKAGNLEIARDRLGDGKEYMDACSHIMDKINNKVNLITNDALNNNKTTSLYAKYAIAIIFIISLALGILIAIFFSNKMVFQIKKCILSLLEISNGNLAIDPLSVDSKDEFGQLSHEINSMQSSVKNIIKSILDETDNVNNALKISNDNISDLTNKLEDISVTVEELSAGMEETAASSEEINVTSEEIEKAVETIAEKAQSGAESAVEISKKAIELKKNSSKLQTDANDTGIRIRGTMDKALNKATEVEKIKALSEAILSISSQTNLLSLNAAIESARAGEAGKGFSVVANEIKKLAEGSEHTVKEMQDIINIVFEAVGSLSNASKDTLNYIETKVVKSYEDSILVGENYYKDAQYVDSLVSDLSATSQELLASIKTVVESINQISKANIESSDGTSNIAEKISIIKDEANKVKLEANYVKDSSDNLKNIVFKFKI